MDTREFGAAVVVLAVLAGATCNGPGGPGDPEARGEGGSSEELGTDAPATFAVGLDTPWEIRFLPGGEVLVTERPGRLTLLSAAGERLRSDTVPGVEERGEGGLMGLALDPEFESSRRIYVCFTTGSGGGLMNRVERFRYDGGLSDREVILDGMEASSVHDGCRIGFGPDGLLFVTMGDAGNADAAQDTTSLNGKVLRVTPEGDPAANNPFDNAVYSYGHRNPQGLAWDDAGRLWSTEHGPSGVMACCRDEVNLVIRGNNYGWPEITGDESASAMVGPVAHSGSDVTWAPAGADWYDGSLYFGGLAGEALYEARIPEEEIRPSAGEPADIEVVAHFSGEYGRIRAVRLGPDGGIYFSTSNRDSRGSPAGDDDRILRVEPEALR